MVQEPVNMMTSSNGHFPRHWHFVRGIHRSPVSSPHKGQWRGALMFSLICARINGWVNNGEACDLRRYRAHYDVTVMGKRITLSRCEVIMWQRTDYVCMFYGIYCDCGLVGVWVFSVEHDVMHDHQSKLWTSFTRKCTNHSTGPRELSVAWLPLLTFLLHVTCLHGYAEGPPLTACTTMQPGTQSGILGIEGHVNSAKNLLPGHYGIAPYYILPYGHEFSSGREIHGKRLWLWWWQSMS